MSHKLTKNYFKVDGRINRLTIEGRILLLYVSQKLHISPDYIFHCGSLQEGTGLSRNKFHAAQNELIEKGYLHRFVVNNGSNKAKTLYQFSTSGSFIIQEKPQTTAGVPPIIESIRTQQENEEIGVSADVFFDARPLLTKFHEDQSFAQSLDVRMNTLIASTYSNFNLIPSTQLSDIKTKLFKLLDAYSYADYSIPPSAREPFYDTTIKVDSLFNLLHAKTLIQATLPIILKSAIIWKINSMFKRIDLRVKGISVIPKKIKDRINESRLTECESHFDASGVVYDILDTSKESVNLMFYIEHFTYFWFGLGEPLACPIMDSVGCPTNSLEPCKVCFHPPGAPERPTDYPVAFCRVDNTGVWDTDPRQLANTV